MSTTEVATAKERRERIVVLLEHYVDVESGMRDRQGTGEHLPLMCRAWRKPEQGYPELDHQLGVLKTQQWNLYRHLMGAYVWAPRRRRHVCPRCHGVVPTWHSKHFHKHGHTTVALVPRVVREPAEFVQETVVAEAVVWLEENWRGTVNLPDELLPMWKAS